MGAVYTYTEARQNLASLLDQAVREGEVRIKRQDGRTFVIKPEQRADSPLDVEGVDLGITTTEIVQFIRESREMHQYADFLRFQQLREEQVFARFDRLLARMSQLNAAYSDAEIEADLQAADADVGGVR